MNREAVIEFVLQHYRAENQGRASTTTNALVITWSALSDANLLACLAWYEAEDWLEPGQGMPLQGSGNTRSHLQRGPVPTQRTMSGWRWKTFSQQPCIA